MDQIRLSSSYSIRIHPLQAHRQVNVVVVVVYAAVYFNFRHRIVEMFNKTVRFRRLMKNSKNPLRCFGTMGIYR